MSNETMRIFFPLKIITYPQGEYGLEDNPEEINCAEAVSYEDAILAVIAKENRLFKNDRGLAEYIAGTELLLELIKNNTGILEAYSEDLFSQTVENVIIRKDQITFRLINKLELTESIGKEEDQNGTAAHAHRL